MYYVLTWPIESKHQIPEGSKLKLQGIAGNVVAGSALASRRGVEWRHDVERFLTKEGFSVAAGGSGFGVHDIAVSLKDGTLEELQAAISCILGAQEQGAWVLKPASFEQN